jgi:hypothetical protein
MSPCRAKFQASNRSCVHTDTRTMLHLVVTFTTVLWLWPPPVLSGNTQRVWKEQHCCAPTLRLPLYGFRWILKKISMDMSDRNEESWFRMSLLLYSAGNRPTVWLHSLTCTSSISHSNGGTAVDLKAWPLLTISPPIHHSLSSDTAQSTHLIHAVSDLIHPSFV